MFIFRDHAARRHHSPRLLAKRMVVLAALLSLCLLPAQASEPAKVVRVEEDWELVIREPDAQTESPQISTVMAPGGNINGVYFAFSLNHRALPDYSAGGMQVQYWNEGFGLDSMNNSHHDLLATPGETVTWTQSLRVYGDQLIFRVKNGHSTTWGDFGGSGNLRLSKWTTLDDLNNYRTEVSVANSGIGYASNRVTSLVLKRVRGYTQYGDIIEDNTERVVFQHD